MKLVRFIIDGEIDINLMITFSTSTVPSRNDIVNLTNKKSNEKYKVKVIQVEHFIKFANSDDPYKSSDSTIEHDYVLYCETITE